MLGITYSPRSRRAIAVRRLTFRFGGRASTPRRGRPGHTRIVMTTSLLCPDAFLSPLEIDAAVTRALAEDLGRAGDVTSIATIPEDTPRARDRGRAQGRRDRRPAAGRRDVSRSSRPTSRSRPMARDGDARRGQDRADDGRRARPRGARRRTRGAQSARPPFRAWRPRRMNSCAASPARTPASAARARPRRGCGRSKNTRCAAAAASIIASASTTPS